MQDPHSRVELLASKSYCQTWLAVAETPLPTKGEGPPKVRSPRLIPELRIDHHRQTQHGDHAATNSTLKGIT